MSRNSTRNYSNTSLPTHHQQSQHSSAVSVIHPDSQDLLYRPESEQLCELHVYIVPSDLWRGNFNNILNNVVTETVSIGIIRVPPDLRLCDIRPEIVEQLQVEDGQYVPQDYVFLRSVGRSLTRLRGKQERQLKAKHFLPPVAFAPELYILEATPELRAALAISERSSQSPPISRRTSPSHRGYPHSYRNGYQGDSDSDPPLHPSSPPVNKYQALPQITHSPQRSGNVYTRYNPYEDRHEAHDKPEHDHYNAYSRKQTNDPYASNRNPNNDPYAIDAKPNNDPYTTNEKPNNDPYNSERRPNDPYNKAIKPELYETPETQRESQPETKVVTEAFSSADPSRGQRSPAPPHSADKQRERRHDDDSGVAGFTPEDEFSRRNPREDQALLSKSRDVEHIGFGHVDNDETNDEQRRRLEDMDRYRWESDEEERRRLAENDRRRQEEEERRAKEEEERRRREENERLRGDDEEEKRRKSEEEEAERRRKEEQEKQEEERLRNRRIEFQEEPSTPDFQERDTQSAQQRRREEKDRLLQEIEEARQLRQRQEREREELVRRAKSMQHKTTNRRNEARDMWKKKYFEEKKKTAPMEESRNRSEQELEALHRRLMNTLEGPREKNLKLANSTPSLKNNYVIQCTKLQHEIEDLQRRVDNSKMKLTAEMKLRNQAQGELRALRAELTQNKTSLTATRQQQMAELNPHYQARSNPQYAPVQNKAANNLYGF